jgi:hypothetical protein
MAGMLPCAAGLFPFRLEKASTTAPWRFFELPYWTGDSAVARQG